MKRLFLLTMFSICSVIVFTQDLKNPTMKAPFTESRGNFLLLTPFDKIGKSEITVDYVTSLRQELNDSKKLVSEQQKLINEQTKEVTEIKKLVSTLQRQLDEQKRKIENLERKVK
jgi:peptidoglycan hydrolase CwlO-like protein